MLKDLFKDYHLSETQKEWLKETLKERKKLEKQSTSIFLNDLKNILSENRKGTPLSCSPGYLAYCANKGNRDDVESFKGFSERIHYLGKRGVVEKEIKKMLEIDWEDYENRFFEFKNYYIDESFESFNKKIQWDKGKRVKKHVYHRIIKLLKYWEYLSAKEHYKLSNAEKRINKKNKKNNKPHWDDCY